MPYVIQKQHSYGSYFQKIVINMVFMDLVHNYCSKATGIDPVPQRLSQSRSPPGKILS